MNIAEREINGSGLLLFFFLFFSEASCMNSTSHDDTGIGWSVSVYSFLVVD